MSAATEEKAETPKAEASVADDTAGADADPPEKPSGEKVKGVVNWFNVAKGFGFVTRDDGVGDVFVHQSDIYAEGFRSLREQEPVEFELEPIGDGRFKAVNVSGPDGAFVQGALPRSSYGRQRVNFPMGGRGGVHPMARGLPPGMPYGVMAGGRVMGGHPGMGGPGMGYMPTMVHPGMPHMGVPGYPGMPMAPGMGAGMMPPLGPGGYQQVGEGGMPVPLPNIMGTEFGVQTGKRVVVLNLPWSTTWQALKEFFSGSGNIVRADIALDESGRSRGYGTVKFNTEEEASRAIATLNGADFEGRIITVRMDKFQN